MRPHRPRKPVWSYFANADSKDAWYMHVGQGEGQKLCTAEWVKGATVSNGPFEQAGFVACLDENTSKRGSG